MTLGQPQSAAQESQQIISNRLCIVNIVTLRVSSVHFISDENFIRDENIKYFPTLSCLSPVFHRSVYTPKMCII